MPVQQTSRVASTQIIDPLRSHTRAQHAPPRAAASLTSVPGASSSSSRKRWLACVGGAALLMRWSVARDLVAPEVVEAYCGLALPKGDAEAIGVCTGSMLCGVVPLGRGGPVCELGVRAWVVAEAER